MKLNRALCLYYNYLNHIDEENKQYYDLLRYVLDQRIYYFGDNFLKPYERHTSTFENVKYNTIRAVTDLFVFIKSITQKPTNDKIKIWSSAYFNLPEKINNEKYQISRPPWAYSKKGKDIYNFDIYKKIKNIKDKLDFANVNELLEGSFFKKIDDLKESLKEFVLKEDIRAVLLPSDLGFFDKLIIQIFKEVERPSFLLIHGLPGIYGKVDNNRTDYLVVWGKSIKQHYADAGVDPNKIIVNGHPKYTIVGNGSLKFDFNDILVLPKAMTGAPMGDDYSLRDRSNCIYYMLVIQCVLKKLGVTKVKFRPHPSESSNWYLKYLDVNFFVPDKNTLANSLKQASLVIGPTSTVFLESLLSGVNYTVFEPRLENGNGMDNFPVVPPFNGSHEKVPSSSSEMELYDMLKSSRKVDVSVLEDYLEPGFDPNLILSLIK